MASILISPSKYVQGAGELKKLGEYVSKLGKNALALISESGYKRVGKDIKNSFDTTSIGFDFFNGECSMTEIERLKKIVAE